MQKYITLHYSLLLIFLLNFCLDYSCKEKQQQEFLLHTEECQEQLQGSLKKRSAIFFYFSVAFLNITLSAWSRHPLKFLELHQITPLNLLKSSFPPSFQNKKLGRPLSRFIKLSIKMQNIPVTSALHPFLFLALVSTLSIVRLGFWR